MPLPTFSHATQAPTMLLEMTPNIAATRLDIARRGVDKLQHAAILPTPLTEAAVESIARRPALTVASGELSVLRTGATRGADEPDRTKIGFHLADDDDTLATTSLRWWRGDPGRIVDNTLFAVTVGTVPVAVYEITALEDSQRFSDGIRHRFSGTLLARLVPRADVNIGTGLSCLVEDEFAAVARVHRDHPLHALAAHIMSTRVAVISGGPIGYLAP